MVSDVPWLEHGPSARRCDHLLTCLILYGTPGISRFCHSPSFERRLENGQVVSHCCDERTRLLADNKMDRPLIVSSTT